MRLVSLTVRDSFPLAVSPQESELVTIVIKLEPFIPNEVYGGVTMRGFSGSRSRLPLMGTFRVH